MTALAPFRWTGLAAAILAALAAFGAVPLSGRQAGQAMYREGWIDFNKNGQKDPYEDPAADVEARIDDLLGRMTLEEKTCQLATLYGYKRVLEDPLPTPRWKTEVWKDGIGNIDEHCNGVRGAGRDCATPPSRHAEVVNTVQRFFVEETRLGIPVDFTNEGIRGLCHWGATSFPASVGIGCTWDAALVRDIGRVTGREARALGYTNVYAPILDLARDPRWGRVVETYAEDPFLASVLGVQMVLGLQEQDVTSTVKHFAVYSVPKGGRDGESRTDPHESPREIENVFLAPFRAAFQDGGALGVMSSYNDYDGIPVTGSRYFLIDKLRREYGFKGYVVSDSNAVRFLWSKHHVAADYKDAVRQAIDAGLNVRTEFNSPANYILPLRELVREGTVSQATLDSRVRDVLRVKFVRHLFDRPYVAAPAEADRIVRAPEHLELARRASRESMVLLKNAGGVLPLRKDLRSVLVVGPNASSTSFANNRYGPYDPPTISVLEGVKRIVSPRTDVKYALGCALVDANWPDSEILPDPLTPREQTQIDEAVALARQADAVIAVVGESDETVGESRSRTSLDLPGRQLDLLKALHATGRPMVVVLINGRALTVNWVDKYVPGILEATFPGEFGGLAVAQALFGDLNPGGRLSFTVPRTVGQLPMNFPTKPAAQADETGREGRRAQVNGVLYPFGHGLSYTTFAYERLQVSPPRARAGETIRVSVDVRNNGARAGDEVVQLYLVDLLSSVTTYEKVLRGFARTTLAPGEQKTVSFSLGPKDLQLLDANGRWVVEPGTFEVQVGSSSTDIRLKDRFEIDRERPADASPDLAGARFERVDVTRDVPFASVRDVDGAEIRLTLDVYQPSGDPGPSRAAIVWIHGGGFRPGVDKRQGYIVTLATTFARRGYVSIAPDYRVRAQPDRDRAGTIRDAVADVQAAHGWLLAKSSELRLSPQRIAVAGGSAGGRTAVGFVTAEHAGTGTSQAPRPCAAVVLWGSPDPSYGLAPPTSRFPPTLLIHGTRDVTVPYADSERLAATLRAQGVDAVLVPLPEAAHTPVEHIDLIVETIAGFLERVCAPAPTP